MFLQAYIKRIIINSIKNFREMRLILTYDHSDHNHLHNNLSDIYTGSCHTERSYSKRDHHKNHPLKNIRQHYSHWNKTTKQNIPDRQNSSRI
jgi:hypothetical protein